MSSRRRKVFVLSSVVACIMAISPAAGISRSLQARLDACQASLSARMNVAQLRKAAAEAVTSAEAGSAPDCRKIVNYMRRISDSLRFHAIVKSKCRLLDAEFQRGEEEVMTGLADEDATARGIYKQYCDR